MRKVRTTMGLTPPLLSLTAEFAAYSDQDESDMIAEFVEKRQHIFEAVTAENLSHLDEAPQRVFPSYCSSTMSMQSVKYYLSADTLHYLDTQSARLIVVRSQLARVAFLDGMAVAMEQERFVPEPWTLTR